MKKIVYLLLWGFSLPIVFAQEAKNFDAAQKLALKQEKNILLVFSGSDWCGPCIKMDRKLWSQPEFQAYADKELILFKADFPKKKKNQLSQAQQKVNEGLAAQYNPEGYFPLVLLLSPQGNILKQFGYDNRGPADFIKALE